MLRYSPVIMDDKVYYPMDVIAKAFCLDDNFLRSLVNKTDIYGECLHNENRTFIPMNIFMKLNLPFDKPMLHFLYGFMRTRYLLREMKRDTEFDYDDYEEDDYFG